MNLGSLISAFTFLILTGCTSDGTEKRYGLGYNLSKPDAAFILPGALYEVSGITYLEGNNFACIQDENGIIFIYDVINNKLVRQLHFNINGDYEAIARVDSKIYVLRSDGALFEISDYKSEKFKLDVFFTNIPSVNNEGLCYDPSGNRLLIACKGQTSKGSEYKDKREIYGFDLKTKTLIKKPIFEFELDKVRQLATERNLNLPMKGKKKGRKPEPKVEFMTSDIGIHPVTNKLFILSSSDHLLLISDMNGNIEDIELLNPIIFNNAEGVAFFDNGDMVITNEGGGKNPSLLRFKYHIKK